MEARTRAPARRRGRTQSAQTSRKRVARPSEQQPPAGTHCFTEEASDAFKHAFAWNFHYTDRVRDLRGTNTYSAHFQFAGGGGAETACRALSAAGVPMKVKTCADWDRSKRKALQLQDHAGEVCMFRDIFHCVHEDCRASLESTTQDASISRDDVHKLLALKRGNGFHHELEQHQQQQQQQQ